MSNDVFKFAAKAGSLEGYLYERQKLDDLNDWVNNIVNMYHALPPKVRPEIGDSLRVVLNRCLTYGDRTLDPALKAKLSGLLNEIA